MSSAPANELRDAYATDRVAVYLMRLWARREYVWFVARSELRSRQMTSLLGNVWHLLNPALSIAVPIPRATAGLLPTRAEGT